MSKYNTFVVFDCKARKTILCTSSARKSILLLIPGRKIEVWNENALIEKIYSRQKNSFWKYIKAEKEYIKTKQSIATLRNKKAKGVFQ